MEIKNSFLADAIASLADLGKKAAEPTFHEVNGRTFLVTGSDYTEVEPPELAKPGMYITRSLNALVVLVKTEVDTLFGNDALPLYVSCNSYDSVKVFTRPIADADLYRWTPYTANASDLPPLVEDVRWSFDGSDDQAPLHVPAGARGREKRRGLHPRPALPHEL